MKRLSPRLRSGLSLLAVILVVGAASEGWRAWTAGRLGAEVASLARPGDIDMISSDTCIYCARARAWFNEHGVPFTECSIERDADCAARFEALRSPGTPVLLVRGKPQVGFSPPAVADALRRS
jgi:glutaredoxin